MRFSPRLRFLMKALDVGLELLSIDAPDAATPDLDRRELSRADQGIHLRDADTQIRGDVLQREESRLDLVAGLVGGRLAWHPHRIPKDNDGYMDLTMFAPIDV